MSRLPHRPLLLATCIALSLAACSDDTADTASADDTLVTTITADPTSTIESTTTTTTEPDLTPEQEVEAAYLETVRHYYERLLDPDPQDPTILKYHTGPSLDQVTQHNRQMVSDGHRERFSERGVPTPTIKAISFDNSSTARVTNCYVDDVIVYVAATGEVVDDTATTLIVESVLVHHDGSWKLSEQLVIERTPGPVGCQ